MVLVFEDLLPDTLKTLAEKYKIILSSKASTPYLLWKDNELSFFPSLNEPRISLNFKNDFSSYRRQKVSPKKHILARALGLDKNPHQPILDGTLGFGKDAFLLMTLGAPVVGVEKVALQAFMVEAEFSLFLQCFPGTLDFRVIHGDVRDVLASSANIPEVLYLDPMFEKTSGGALPKKHMAFLRQSQSGALEDFQDVLLAARNRSLKRIVVKRPRKGDHLFGKPSYEISGKMIRYDIYYYPEA